MSNFPEGAVRVLDNGFITLSAAEKNLIMRCMLTEMLAFMLKERPSDCHMSNREFDELKEKLGWD